MLKASLNIFAIFSLVIGIIGCQNSVDREVSGSIVSPNQNNSSTIGSAETIIVSSSTRFKSTLADRTDATSDGTLVCAVEQKTQVVVKKKPQLVSDGKHVFVQLARSLPNCRMTEGFFFAEHLFGADWISKVDPQSIENPQSASADKNTVTQTSATASGYNASWGAKIAAGVKNTFYSSQSRCYEYVAYHFERAGLISYNDPLWSQIGESSAYMFGQWASYHPGTLKNVFGLKQSYEFSRQPTLSPVGSVLVYDPGVCGYSSSHGHIEIVVEPNYACSDFCKSITPPDCGTPRVFIPVGR